MSSSIASIPVHVVFSTKHREPTIPQDLLPDLFSFIGGVCHEVRCRLICAGGMSDHVHLLVSLGRTCTVADLLMHTKRASSLWLKNQRSGSHLFAWQDGYFAFGVGHDDIDLVRAYFERQAVHHQTRDFKSEVLAFVEKYQVEHDPARLWD